MPETTETTETTLMGWKAWTAIGIVVSTILLMVGGYINPETRPYVEKAVGWCLNFISAISKF